MKSLLKKIIHKIGLYDRLLNFRRNNFPSSYDILEKNSFLKRKQFYSQFIKTGKLCFDIGANHGNRTEVFLSLNAKVVAVEPQKSIAKKLREKFKKKIIVVEKGVGSNEELKEFFISNFSTLSTFSKEWISTVLENRISDYQCTHSELIQITTLDNLITEFGKPDFCKIDVEGYELEVFKGLTQPLKILSFEYAVPEYTSKAIECINYLSQIGKIRCNYSICDSMELAMKEWINANKMIEIIYSADFNKTIFGDIYITFE